MPVLGLQKGCRGIPDRRANGALQKPVGHVTIRNTCRTLTKGICRPAGDVNGSSRCKGVVVAGTDTQKNIKARVQALDCDYTIDSHWLTYQPQLLEEHCSFIPRHREYRG